MWCKCDVVSAASSDDLWLWSLSTVVQEGQQVQSSTRWVYFFTLATVDTCIYLIVLLFFMLACRLLWTSSEDVVCQYLPTQLGSPRGLQHTMPYIVKSSWHLVVQLELETSSWSSSCSLDRPTSQWHQICPCKPLELGRTAWPWWSNATARAGYVMTMSYCFCTNSWVLFYSILLQMQKARLDTQGSLHWVVKWDAFTGRMPPPDHNCHIKVLKASKLWFDMLIIR